jgi:hexosaminidase
MALPRMLALAERAWAQAPEWSKISDKTDRNDAFNLEWSLFANRVGKVHFDLLYRFFGYIKFRVPCPGIMIKNDTLFANTSFPGLTIRYTTDGSNPGIESPVYLKPLKINFSEIKLITFSPSGNFSRVIQWQVDS